MSESRLNIVKAMAEIESTYGTEPSWSPADDGFFLVNNANPVRLDTNRVTPAYLRETYTPLKDLIGRQLYRVEPMVYIQGTGTVGEAPRFNDLLRACLLQETVASSSVTYVPRSSSLESASMLVGLDGVVYEANGLRGNFVMSGSAGQPGEIQFTMLGLYNKPVTESTEFTSFSGGTNNAETLKGGQVSIDNGTVNWNSSNPAANPLVVKSFSFDRGVQIGERSDWNDSDAFAGLGIERTQPTLELVVEAKNTMTGLPDFWGDLTASVMHAVGFRVGTSAGNIWTFDFPTAQLVDAFPSDGEAGTRNYTFQYQIQHDDAESEFSIVLT